MTLSSSRQGPVAVIAFDDGKANALGPATIAELTALLDEAEGGDARAVVIHGRPGVFSAGFDLKVMRSGVDPMRDLVLAGGHLLVRLFGSPLPVVVGCTGHALAAGALLLLAADHRVGPASTDPETAAKIGLNEVAIGLRLPIYAVELARHRLPVTSFEAATVRARVTGPDDAVVAGFLDELVIADDVAARAIQEANRLAALDGEAYAATKALARRATIDLISKTLDADVATLAPPPAS